MAKKDITETIPAGERVVRKKVPTMSVKNISTQKIEWSIGGSLIIFAPGETKELPKESQIPSNIGLIII